MGRLKNEEKVKLIIEKRVSMIINNLKVLRALGIKDAQMLSDVELNKIRVTLVREVEATTDAVSMQKIHLQEGVKGSQFSF